MAQIVIYRLKNLSEKFQVDLLSIFEIMQKMEKSYKIEKHG